MESSLKRRSPARHRTSETEVDMSDQGLATRGPKVSRRVNTCTACQVRKIKCDLYPDRAAQGKSTCSRCDKKDIRCVVKKSLQSLLEEDRAWKNSVHRDTGQLQLAVSEILRTLNLPELSTFAPPAEPVLEHGEAYPELQAPSVDENFLPHAQQDFDRDRAKRLKLTMTMTRENSREPEDFNEESNDYLVAAPMRSLYEVTKLRNLRNNPRPQVSQGSLETDLISRRRVSETEADELFTTFSQTLNHYLWGGIALVHADLTAVRRSSSLLTAAILAVAALHIPGKEATFDTCYAEYLGLIRDTMLDRGHTLDGIRALCIGAFWLTEVSWKLSGHAVRIATELNLHKSYVKALKGSPDHLEGARLWYLLYVCDHHFSVAYGRPPVIHADATIHSHEKFLHLPGISQADVRLHSQVAIFIILTEIYHNFQSDAESRLTDDDLNLLLRFNQELDEWCTKWQPRLGKPCHLLYIAVFAPRLLCQNADLFLPCSSTKTAYKILAPSPYISSYPSKGVLLHHQYAKLQLNSLALRGFQQLACEEMSIARRNYANLASSCATSVLRIAIQEPEMRAALVGVPLYIHTMITYAAVFLLKAQQQWRALQLDLDSALVHDLIGQVIRLLNDGKSGDRHMSCHIASGLTKLLQQQHSADMATLQLERSSRAGVEPYVENTNQSDYPAVDVGPLLNSGPFPFSTDGQILDLYENVYLPTGFLDFSAFGSNVQPDFF